MAGLVVAGALCGACSGGYSKPSSEPAEPRATTTDAATLSSAAKTTTTVPSRSTTTVPLSQGAADGNEVSRTVDDLNGAFARSVSEGIAASTVANYWVGAGVYTADQCGAFESANGGDRISVLLVPRAYSLRADPGWVDPVIGAMPQGRIYTVDFDDIRTDVSTGAQRRTFERVHVTVLGDRGANLLLRCH